MDRPVRVAVVGLGWPGQQHLGAYAANPAVEVIAVCDVADSLREAAQARYGIPRGFTNLAELLALPELDAVSICTPNYLHEPMVTAAIQAGKHVLCEKPLAASLAQGERAAAAARASDRVCMIGVCRRYREDSRAVKAIIANGDLGEVYHAHTGWLRSRWNPAVTGWFLSKERSGGGPLIDLGVHMLDLAMWLMGNPKAMSVSGTISERFQEKLGSGRPVDVEDQASAYVRLDNGASLILETSWFAYGGAADHIFCQLLGSRGGVKIDLGAGATPVEVHTERAGVPMIARPAYPVSEADATRVQFANEIAEFVGAIREQRAPDATMEQGLEILRILDAIYRSAKAGAEVRL